MTSPILAACKFMAWFFLPHDLPVKIWVLQGHEQTSGAKLSYFCILQIYRDAEESSKLQ